MIISPPFLPEAGLAAPTGTNPDLMMDAVDKFECAHGVYPIAFDRRWHCGVHLQPNTKSKVYAIADGEVVAYRVCQHGVDSGTSHTGFVLLKHTTETGEGRTLTFYSLYMHLLPLVEYGEHSADSKELPYEFLRMPTGPVSKGQVTPAVSGEGKKVRRKDVLGWLGKYEDMPHLHFEIFMLPEDFDAYFGRTQLGNSTPTPPAPTETDWWGHAYFVIPAGSTFRRLPEKADARNKLHGIAFKPGHEGSNTLPLLVETYFSLGSKYTNVWSLAQDGTRALLTPQPVEEKDYEYDLYKRATALYSSCPSDGYELLRFGRILSTDKKLAADACVTWMQVNWAADRAGYIDINDSNIHKFSDADFLSFMGWQKISNGNTPFGSDGLCDVDALKKIVKVAAEGEQPTVVVKTTENQKAAALSNYVKYNDQVRQQLYGFVCNAPSEWDSTNNEERYAKLLDEGGYYHGNDKGYNDFMKYLKEVQFWNKTGLPAGQKLWFFHPLAFIRHFRKSAWFSKEEFALLYSDSHMSGNASAIREKYRKSLNFSLRKYGLMSYLKQAHFLGQGAVESNFLCTMQESSMVGKVTEVAVYGVRTNPISVKSEKDLGHWYGEIPSEDDPYFRLTKYNSKGGFIASSYDWRFGNCDREDAQKFRGRGFKQITFRSNYSDYWLYRGWIHQSNFTASWWSDPQYGSKNRVLMKKIPARIDNPQIIATEPENCLDSGAWYIACLRPKVVRAIDKDSFCIPKTVADFTKEEQVIKDVTKGINGELNGIDKRIKYTRMIKEILL
ncbi:M23 family metallopeptidase [Burkholderia sp. S-53]|uniref:M23 family metallopeptidase n=1 Tax=Burkholderia sp. S-53 TaxID=2906514 RepID=UPI0021D07002|nr:M23 family metallopeptidase [Burkholderia sp. S-53]UXU91939.1 M23 family metallopeptidase [Burkholderia sp. S-53]